MSPRIFIKLFSTLVKLLVVSFNEPEKLKSTTFESISGSMAATSRLSQRSYVSYAFYLNQTGKMLIINISLTKLVSIFTILR